MLLNKVKTPSDHRAAIRGVMGGENFFKNRQSYTKLLKGRLTANEGISRPFWSLEPPQIPVSGSHNPEVAGSSPVSATMSSEDNGFRYLHSFLLQQQGFCLAAFLMPGGGYTRSLHPGAHPPDNPCCSERRFQEAQYSRRSGNRSRSAGCGSCRSPAPHTRRCGR